METQILHCIEENDCKSSIQAASELILRGGLVAFPTETVYGLGANALDADACARIYEAKGRPSDNPLIIHIAEPGDIDLYAYPDKNGILKKLAEAFMPGPLTVVLKKKPIVPSRVTGGLDTVAIRCPANPIASALIKKCGVPIAAPSANLSGSPSPTRAEHVINDLDGRIDAILCGDAAAIGVESTIVSVDDDGLKLLRPGFVTVEDLLEICKNVQIDKAVTQKLQEGERPLAPGMSYRHYAPKAPMIMVCGSNERVYSFFSRVLEEENSVICFSEDVSCLSSAANSDRICVLGSSKDSLSQAKNLFDVLRQADQCGAKTIYTRMPPKDGVGFAVFNRMIKACGFRFLDLDCVVE